MQATAPAFSRRPGRAEPPISSPSPDRAAATPRASPSRRSQDRPSLPHHELDAAVLRLSVVGVISGDPLPAAIAHPPEPVRRQAPPYPINSHPPRAPFPEPLV